MNIVNWQISAYFGIQGWSFGHLGNYFEWVCGIYQGLSEASADTGAALKISLFEKDIDYYEVISSDVVALLSDETF